MDGIVEQRARRSTDDGNSDRVETYRRQAQLLLTQRRHADAELVLREALRLRPDCPDLVNKLGSTLWEQGRPDQSEPFFRRAIELKPDDWVIRNNLGLALWDQGRAVEAADCYRQVLSLNPAANEARMNLGVVLSDLGRFEEALEHLREAVRVNPHSPDTVQNLGMTLGRMGNWHEALQHYNRALELKPDYAEVHRNRAYAWLYLGDFERGWPEHEWRLRCRKHSGCRVERPLWQGEDLGGRPILLHAEQGYGDTLQFIRYAAEVKRRGGVVLVLAQTHLLRIVARCEGVDLAFDGSSLIPSFELHAPLMSLPAILGTTQATVPARVPYLPTEPLVVERWRRVLANALGQEPEAMEGQGRARANGRGDRPFLVGVAWQGSPGNPLDHFRSFPLAALAPVAEVPGVRLVGVQAVDGLDQIPALDGRFPILELTTRRPRDFVDTAALISLLDLVITPDTAIAHMAGGLGVPVWLGLSSVGEWRWMVDREDSPWYPTMRIFRQTRFGDWYGVFHRMAEMLRGQLAPRAASAA